MKSKYGVRGIPLELWEKITLTVSKNCEQAEFFARVEDLKKNSIVIESPLRQSGSIRLEKGDDVEVSFNRKDATYIFKANIADFFEDEGGSLELNVKSDVSRMQRRRFVRLDISGNIHFRVLECAKSPDGALSPRVPGSLLNISAGGILFETRFAPRENDILVVSLALKGDEKLENILSVAKRVEKLDDNLHLVGAEFITEDNMADYGLEQLRSLLPAGTGTFDENLQKLVLQFIYKQQIERKKKGLTT